MKHFCAAIIAILVFLANRPVALAGEFEGAGVKYCSDFIDSYKADPSSASMVYFGWAEGFMSGLNVTRLNDDLAFKSMPIEQQKAHLLKFCYADPSERYAKAVVDLYTTIYPKQKD